MRDRRAERRQETIDEIVATAWRLARADGLAALSLRELAAEVGMRPQSLYTYVDAKNDIYDAMYAEGAVSSPRASSGGNSSATHVPTCG
jgi:AcrR family transcriptional regulator